jgi:hypothetical protein
VIEPDIFYIARTLTLSVRTSSILTLHPYLLCPSIILLLSLINLPLHPPSPSPLCILFSLHICKSVLNNLSSLFSSMFPPSPYQAKSRFVVCTQHGALGRKDGTYGDKNFTVGNISDREAAWCNPVISDGTPLVEVLSLSFFTCVCVSLSLSLSLRLPIPLSPCLCDLSPYPSPSLCPLIPSLPLSQHNTLLYLGDESFQTHSAHGHDCHCGGVYRGTGPGHGESVRQTDYHAYEQSNCQSRVHSCSR